MENKARTEQLLSGDAVPALSSALYGENYRPVKGFVFVQQVEWESLLVW